MEHLSIQVPINTFVHLYELHDYYRILLSHVKIYMLMVFVLHMLKQNYSES